MEPSCVGPNQNRTPTLGLRKTLALKEEVSKVSLRGHPHALKCIPKGWLVVAANARSHDPVRVL
jgi:hypothetical protein